jgi:zinc transport system substrate-binding protein
MRINSVLSKFVLSLPALFLLGSLCAAESVAPAEEPLRVFVGIPPAKWLVERVGGDRTAVQVMVPPGRSPHVYEPTPRQMVDLAKSRVYFGMGSPFEETLLPRIRSSHPKLRVEDCSKGVERRKMEAHHDHEDEHGHDKDHAGDHDLENLDPHVWLSAPNLHKMAVNICQVLTEESPSGKAAFESNRDALIKELDEVDKHLAEVLRPLRGRAIYVFHPAFGYFTDQYGLVQKAVELEGKSPTARQLRDLVRQAREDQVRVLFVQPQFDQRAIQTLAESIDGAVTRLDPLAEDVLKNLRHMADEIEKALKKP